MQELGRVMLDVLKPRAFRTDANAIGMMTHLWPQIVGTAIAHSARPVALSAGTLTLECESASWALQLQGMTEELRAAVNGYLRASVIKKIQVRFCGNAREMEREASRREQIWL